MNAKTLKALKGSIAKWEKIVAGTGTDQQSSNCPLCAVFADNYPPCSGCPVAEKSGDTGCEGTPYEIFDANSVWSGKKCGYVARNKKGRDAARAELAFLKSLLPRKRK